jgi:hypothetical protein
MVLLWMGITSIAHAQTLIAGWDFQTTTTGGLQILGTPNTQTAYPANVGTGNLYLNGTNGSSSWTTAAGELNAFGGASVNATNGLTAVTTSPASLALVGGTASTGNGKSIVFTFSMTGRTGLVVSYASQRTSTGFTSQAWSYSFDGINWTPLQTITSIPSSFGLVTLNTTTLLDGAPLAYLKMTVTGSSTSSGNNRLDNVQLSASVAASLTCGPITGSPFCVSGDAGTTVSVPFVFGGTPGGANVYTAQLSNASGSFAAPVNIGTLTSTATSGTVTATIPAGTPSGTGYRIRVIASTPSTTGTNNGTDLTIDRVIATASNNGPICAGLPISFTAAGGNTYSWTGPNGFSSSLQNPAIATTVPADSGVFIVTAISTLGCTDTASTLAYIQDCGCVPPVTTGSSTPPSCNGGSNGSIDITVTGGIGPYTFLWSNGATVEDPSGLTAGNYSVIVTDAVSCRDTFDITIGEPSAISLSFSVTNPGCVGFSNGAVNMTINGGTPGYSYLWDNGAVTEDITGLAAGLYSVTVTDANGCIQNGFASIVDPPVFTINLTPSDVVCAGVNNGAIDLTASNDTSTTNPGLLISEFLANPANTDSSKEWIELIATKNIDFSVTPYTIITANNGTATTKGWTQGLFQTYAFQISSGTVVPGEVVYVGGSNMAVSGRKIRVIDVSTTPGDGGIGNASTGGIVGNGTGNADGIAVFNLPVAAIDSNTVPVDAVFYGTAIGTALLNGGADGYTLPVNDRYNGGRLQSTSFIAPDPTSLFVKANGVYNKLTGVYSPIRTWSTDVAFTDGSSGVTVVVGNSFLWSNGATSEDLTGLGAGTYTVTATSATGCTATATATINAPAALALSGTVFDATCFGFSDGGIDLTVTGGVAPLTYQWNDLDVNEDRSSIPTGQYSVLVTDANGCTAADTFLVNQPNDFVYSTQVTNTSCFGAGDGAIDLTITGGTLPYTFSWSNGDVTEDITNQPANFYFFNITDANGCGTGGLDFINDPAQIIINGFTPNTGGAGVLVTINGSGFTGVSGVEIDGVPVSSYTVLSDFAIQAIVPAGASTGFITIRTSPACFTTSIDTFFYNPTACVPPVLNATPTSVSCNGGNDGAIDLNVTGGTAPYSYGWSNSAITEDITGLNAGTYTVIVSDANNCPDTLSIIVTEPAAVALPAGITNVSCNGLSDGAIDLTVTGGTAPYIIFWSTGALTEDINGLLAGTYTVTVTDNNNCAATTTYDVLEPAVLTVSLNGTDPLCAGSNNGSITSSVSGGTAAFTYLWNNGAVTADLTNITAGVYTLTVTDDNGCTAGNSVTINDPSPFTLSLVSSSDVICFGGNSGAIDIAASNDPIVPPANPGLLISEFLSDPAGTDAPFEWVELIATKSINFSATPYTVVFTNNGTATTKGWRIGGNVSYAFQISTGVVNPGDVFYVGGSSMAPTGLKLRTINNSTTAGDVFGSVGGSLGNGGPNADGIGVFALPAAAIDSSSVPVDAFFFGSGYGTTVVAGGTAGYTLPVNDLYSGGFFNTGSLIGSNSVSGSSFRATGSFNISNGTYVTRTWAINPTFTDGTSAITVVTANTYSWSNGATSQDITGLVAGNYTVTATNPAGCTATLSLNIQQPNDLTITGFSPVSGNTGTAVVITGTGFTGADQVLFNGTAAVFTIDNDGQISTTVPAGATTGNITIINDACDTVISTGVFTIATNLTLNLTMLFEGMYDGAGGLVPALLNSGVGLSSTECDTILVELRDQISTTTVLASGTAVLGTNGQASFSFPGSVNGATGYIAVFHRNAVQTWSDLVTFSSTTNYDFTTAATQAFGGNQKEVAPGVWAFYSGDVAPQDEVVDIFDVIPMDNDVINFAFGYVPTDLTGDGVVDIFDVIVLDNNVINFAASVHP